MDVENLISAVEDKIPLWNMKDRRYHSRDIQKKLWAKVAEEVGSSEAEVKRKWKSLRDVFRREYKKNFKSGEEAPDHFISSWPYFQQMLFLMDPRGLKGNLALPEMEEACENKAAEVGYEVLEAIADIEPDTEECLSEPMEARNTQRKRKMDAIDPYLQIEREKLRLYSERRAMKKDSDYHFLMSLHPFLNKIPENRKLAVRHKMQQILIDEEPPLATISGED